MNLRTLTAAVTAAALLGPAAVAAHASDPGRVIGLEIQVVDPAAKTVTGVQHCVPPEVAGQTRTFVIDLPSVSPDQLRPGSLVGVEVAWEREPAAITRIGVPPCNAQPQGGPPPGGTFPGPDALQRGPGGHDGPPSISSAFTNRVWKFQGEADGFSGGILSMTLEKVLNLPRRMATQDDEIVDQDTAVIVDPATRVYDGKKAVKQRAESALLADAESVRVQGKLLRPSKWRKDEDGEPIATIRAKKIYILD